MIHTQLRSLRQRTPLSIRAVAELLGFDSHSKYAYYESPRFKGPLPIWLAARLTDAWAAYGVQGWELLELAGLPHEEAIARASARKALDGQPTIMMEVRFPTEDHLFAMFMNMFEALDLPDLTPHTARIASYFASFLPLALESTRLSMTVDEEGGEIDEDLVHRLRLRRAVLDGVL